MDGRGDAPPNHELPRGAASPPGRVTSAAPWPRDDPLAATPTRRPRGRRGACRVQDGPADDGRPLVTPQCCSITRCAPLEPRHGREDASPTLASFAGASTAVDWSRKGGTPRPRRRLADAGVIGRGGDVQEESLLEFWVRLGTPNIGTVSKSGFGRTLPVLAAIISKRPN